MAATPPPRMPLATLLNALDDDGAATSSLSSSPPQLRLPRVVGHYRALEVCVEGVVRAVLTLTPRLAFITMQQSDAEAEEEEAAAAAAAAARSGAPAAPPAKLVQVVLKLGDHTGWTAAQQAACKAQMRVGQRMGLHAFVEINPPTNTPAAAAAAVAAPSPAPSSAAVAASAAASSPLAVVAASSSSAVAAAVPLESTSLAWEVRSIAPIAAAVCDQPLVPTAGSVSSVSSEAPAAQPAPLPPIEARLSLHAISIVLGPVPGAAEADATSAGSDAPAHADTQLCTHAVAHSARYVAAMAEGEPEAANQLEPSPSPRTFPDIALALRERVEMAAAAEAKRAAAAAAAAAASADGSADGSLPLSHKKRQKGEPRKRAPKCNMNRGLKFFQFLESTFGLPLLSSGSGVLDVAGGQGIVSWELSKRDLPTVVVDPRPISGAWTQRRARYLNIRKKIAEELGSRPEPTFRHLQCLFDPSFPVDESTRPVWESTPLVVGMHPDEATDPIVALSLAAGKPWAVIPCCVFPNLHPHRRTPQGDLVRTHEQLCAYYLGLHPDIRSAQLDFEGRSTVIYHMGRPAAGAGAGGAEVGANGALTSSSDGAATAAASASASASHDALDDLVSATAAAALGSSSSSSPSDL